MRLYGSAMGASRKEGGGGGGPGGLYGHAPSSFRVEMLSVRLLAARSGDSLGL